MSVLFDIDRQGVATLTLNRPEMRNAFDDGLIEASLACSSTFRQRRASWCRRGRRRRDLTGG